MAIRTPDQLRAARDALLRNDAAAASIQPAEVKALLNDMVDTSESGISGAKATAANAVVMAQGAQFDATKALADADTAQTTAQAAQTTAAESAKAAGEAKATATSANQIAIGARATANNNYDRVGDIERRLIGIDNDIIQLNAGGDTADWALEEDTSQIPANKLGNASDQTARSSAANAINIAGANSLVINALPVFATTTLNPAGVRGTDLPKYIALELANKITRDAIIQVEVYTQGQLLTRVNNVTSAALITQINSHGGLINIEPTEDIIETISNNLESSAQDLRFQVAYKFTGTNLGTGTPADQVDEVHFGVNNKSFLHQPELIGAANFNITSRNVFSQGDGVITLPRIGFGMVNMGKRAGNQAADLSHHIINFETITALTASSHGQAADNVATFGFVSSNRNYRLGRTNGNRLLIASDGGSTDAIPATLYRM